MATRPLCTLQFASTQNHEGNLNTLIQLIEQTPSNAIVLAPEVCLSDFDYEHFNEAAQFTPYALDKLLALCKDRIVCLTVIEQGEDGKFYNRAKVLHQQTLVHEQGKHQLFKLGDEHHYFSPSEEQVQIFEVDGIRFGLLICFELRFKRYWQALEGADIILVPARWGKLRSDNFSTLSQALAVINQCYVMASDASNEGCTSRSSITTPFGEITFNGNDSCLLQHYDRHEIKKMRRYLDVGIEG